MHKLEIKNLYVSILEQVILKDFNLQINSGEIHVIMGPNGTGKSTLAKVIMGDHNYKIISGTITFDGQVVNDLSVSKRAQLGIFLGMQAPLEIEGVTNADFLRNVLSNRQGTKFKLYEFIKEIEATADLLKMDKNMIHRGINLGFSGGEKKKNEILQMYMLKPSLVILDEIDSGLDVDSLKIVGDNVTKYYQDKKPGILLITHYQRLLDYIKPDFIHIVVDGTIVKSGNFDLVKEIEQDGYDKIRKTVKTRSCIIKENCQDE